jgi:hypothetical protein
MDHPYKEFEGTKVWRAIDSEIKALEKNGDLELTTARQYVIGSLCKCLAKKSLLVPTADK